MTQPGWRDYQPLDLSPTLSAALAAFREHGYHGTTVRDVAGRAGVTVPVLYYHHGSKQGMLVALFDLAMADLHQRLDLAVADAGVDPQQRFRNIVGAIALHMTYRCDLAVIDSELRYLGPENRTHYLARRDEVQRLLRRAINDGARRGIFRVGHLADTTRALLDMLLGIGTWYRPDSRLSATEIADRYVEIALNTVGLTPRGHR